MTTVTPFIPSNLAPFQFQPTLDGQVYTVTVPWSLFGQRYYVQIAALNGDLVAYLPLIGSPDGIALSGLAWDFDQAVATATTAAPHGMAVGDTKMLTIAGAAPDAYNGTVKALIVDATQFTYPVSPDPGLAAAFGVVTYDISLTAGYFVSTLVFRESSQQFEVSP